MSRSAVINRKTQETHIQLTLNLDEAARGKIYTGSPFLDHMLDLFQVHGGFSLDLHCNGDLAIDMHHSAEDIAICLGQAFKEAMGDKKGIERYGFYYVTMDEALARVALDFSGRFAFHYHVPLQQDRIGNMDVELFKHFFSTFAENARMNLHIDLIRGENTHHCLEGVFKAFARACAMGLAPSKKISAVPSSKGVLD